MAHRLTFLEDLHGWAVPVHRPDDDAFETPTEPVAASFLAAGGAWALITLEALLLRHGGWIPEGTFGGRFPAAAALCAGAGAMSLFAAALYRLPAGLGSLLQYPRLAWAHFGAVQVAALVALWHLAATPWMADLDEDRLVSALTGVLGAGIAAMIGNVVASLDGETWRP